jgi:hypothetical protein
MALTAAEEVTVAEIVLEPLSVVQAVTLTTEQELSVQDDISTWEAIRDSHVKLTGEVDFDNERKRQAIRARIRKMYGLPLFSEESGMGLTGSFAIPNIAVF